MAATASSGCTSFFNLRSSSSSVRQRARKVPAGNRSSTGCGRIDGIAMWLINGMAAVFFASLERCSCMRIATVEDVDEGNEMPLIQNDSNNNPNDKDARSINTDVNLRPSAGRGKRAEHQLREID